MSNFFACIKVKNHKIFDLYHGFAPFDVRIVQMFVFGVQFFGHLNCNIGNKPKNSFKYDVSHKKENAWNF